MNIVQEVREFKALHQISQAFLAKSLRVSEAALSQFLDGKYKGDNEKLGEKLKKFMEKFNQKMASVQEGKLPFLRLSYVDQALYELYEAVTDREIAALTGQAGMGKTTLISHFVDENPNALFFTVRESTTTKILFRTICNALNISESSSIDEMITDIIEELKRGDFILIIDESEHLSYTGLEGIRALWDGSSVPIILVGTDRLIDNLLGKDGKYKQLYSRIGSNPKLGGLNKEDTRRVFESVGVELDNDQGKKIFTVTKGNFRVTVKIMKKVKRLMQVSKSEVVTAEILSRAMGSIILGRR